QLVLLNITILSILLGLTPSGSAYAFDLRDLFKDHFHNHYEPRRCGQNAMAFIRAADRQLGAAGSLQLVTIEDTGFSNLGMVSAEHARRSDRPGQVEDMNWYFHAFVVDHNGLVYDFDFGGEPTIVPLDSYLQEMFVEDNECSLPSGQRSAARSCVPREARLNEYKLTVISGRDVVEDRESQKRTLMLREALTKWPR
ncbi:MAG: hypothetical protein RIQ81_1116, partial [Pseudomonadota bacterium]